jgi:hypothetical protein
MILPFKDPDNPTWFAWYLVRGPLAGVTVEDIQDEGSLKFNYHKVCNLLTKRGVECYIDGDMVFVKIKDEDAMIEILKSKYIS